MASKTTKRIWATGDGGLVLDGDSRARFLRYGEGDVVDVKDEAKVRALLDDAPPATDKQQQADETKPVAKRASSRPRAGKHAETKS